MSKSEEPVKKVETSEVKTSVKEKKVFERSYVLPKQGVTVKASSAAEAINKAKGKKE